MISYLIRRLLLIVPTLVGASFLLFMIVALSPGGVGAALRVAGGQSQATNRAIQEAYIEDRYGLGDPVVVQYLRWLGRISPVKFGARDQVLPDRDLFRAPRDLDEPVLWSWFAGELPGPAEAPPPEIVTPEGATREVADRARDRAYRRATEAYAQARAAYVAATANVKVQLAPFLRELGRADAIASDGEIRMSRLEGVTPDRSSALWPEVRRAGEEAVAAYGRALDARAALGAFFDAKLFPEAGLPLIPGVVSLAPPDLGTSFSKGRPVGTLIAEHLPVTMLINLVAFTIIYAVAVPGGVLTASRANTMIDSTTGLVLVGLWSVPTVWAGVLALGYLAHKDALGWFPVSGLHDVDAGRMPFLPRWSESGFERGYLGDAVWHLALPVMCVVYHGFAVLSKQTRAAMLDNFNADYVRTAKAKGVAGIDIVLRHVFRNSLLPLITIFASIFPAMLAGSVVVERIFSVQGMGYLIIEAIQLKDRDLLLANAMIVATVNMTALLLADVLYALADPRVTFK